MDLQTDEFLDHHGVKGQKWGIRKSERVTGVTRPRGALLDRNARTRQAIKDARSGERFRKTAAIGRAFVGKEQQQRNWNTLLRDLNAQDKRIKAGKLTTTDRLDLFGNTSIFNLVVSHRPA